MKHRFFKASLLITFILIGLTSCGNLFTTVRKADIDEDTLVTVSGSISMDGAVPAELISCSAPDSRGAAFPEIDLSRFEFSVTASNNGDTAPIEGSINKDKKSFSIEGLHIRETYTITIEAKLNEATVFKGEKTLQLLLENVDNITVEVKPLSTGTGNIRLKVGKGSVKVTKIIYTLDNAEPVTVGEVNEETIISIQNVNSGAHTLSLDFYRTETDGKRSADRLIYHCDEGVNVFPNMTTDTWIKTSSAQTDGHLSNNEGSVIAQFVLNTGLTEKYISRTVYVDSDESNSKEDGSIFEPFKAITKAIEYASKQPMKESLEDATVILVKGETSEELSESLSLENVQFTLKAEADSQNKTATIKTGNYNITIKKGAEVSLSDICFTKDMSSQTESIITVESGAEATFINCSFNNGNTSEGSVVKNAGTVSFSSCSFEGNSASSNGGAVYNTGSATFSSCTFKDNSAAAGGAVIYNSNQLTLENCTISYNSQTTAPTTILSEDKSEAEPLITIKGTGNSIAGTIVLKDRSGIKIAVETPGLFGKLDISEHSEENDYLQFLTTDNGLSVAEAQKCFEGFILGDYQDEPQEGKLVLYPNDAVYVAPSTSNSAAENGSFQNPYTTISAALNALNNKTGTDAVTVYIKGGTTSPIEYNWSENIKLTRSATLKVYGTTPAGTETGTATIKPAKGYGFTIDSSGTDAGSITFEAEGLIFDDSTSQAATSGFVTICSNVSSASFTNCQFNDCPATSETAAFSTSASVTLNSCSFSNNVASGGNAGIAIAVNPGAVLTLKGSTWFGENDVIRLIGDSTKNAQIKIDELSLSSNENKSWKIDVSGIGEGKQILTGSGLLSTKDYFTVDNMIIDSYGCLKSGSIFFIDPDTTANLRNGTETYPFQTLSEAFNAITDGKEPVIIKIKNGKTLSVTDGLTVTNTGGITLKPDSDEDSAQVAIQVSGSNCLFNITGTLSAKNIAFERTDTSTGEFAVLDNDASASFNNCTFKNGRGENDGVVKNAGTVSFSSCSFEGNSASSNGGAVYNTGSATFSSCSFEDNSASSNGGAVYNTGSATFSSCTFKDNSAAAGGAIIYNSNQLTLEGCTFSGTNIAEGATAIQTGTKLTLKGKLLLGGYRIEASSEKETIELAKSFTTNEVKIPLYFTSISNFIGANSSNSPFTSGSDLSEVTNFDIVTDHEGYVFNTEGKMIASGTGGQFKIPTSFDSGIKLFYEKDGNNYAIQFKDASEKDVSSGIEDLTFNVIYHTETVPKSQKTWQHDENTITLSDDLDSGYYRIQIKFTYKGALHSVSFDVTIGEE